MDALQKKSIISSRGFTYTYYVSNPAEATKTTPPLFLQHGFPDDSHLWQDVVAKLPGYRVIVPDMLGYAGSSKPTDPSAYEYSAHTKDLTEILDAESVDKVISVGHDWGSIIAQRLYLHHPERVAGVVLLNVAYTLPSQKPFDLPATNAYLEKVYGYPLLAYQEFIISDEGPAILKAHADRVFDGMHGAPRNWMRDLLCQRGSFKKWLLNEDGDWNVEPRDYAKNPELRKKYIERFQRDGFEGPACYYKSTANNVQHKVEKTIPEERQIIKVPVLYIGCLQDAVCRPEALIPAKQGGFLPDLEETTLDCAHWSPLEAPGPVASAIDNFLTKKFST
ncbi:epoxide hydrolase [Truncatella angustata]|uniref:Epoxide hydrolase n=1 Tax=Truncatella angustata TaxID=152316 RepID=A0A9P8ZWC7_9PEZI|nr:epoxide hydrolase [Truncatella angustata]KAH6652832.1 epoxide hydrolase [Truncatella angustata]KAH8198300.1 hypothetical protein TruAng_007550 [Truncatella angustata]